MCVIADKLENRGIEKAYRRLSWIIWKREKQNSRFLKNWNCVFS